MNAKLIKDCMENGMMFKRSNILRLIKRFGPKKKDALGRKGDLWTTLNIILKRKSKLIVFPTCSPFPFSSTSYKSERERSNVQLRAKKYSIPINLMNVRPLMFILWE